MTAPELGTTGFPYGGSHFVTVICTLFLIILLLIQFHIDVRWPEKVNGNGWLYLYVGYVLRMLKNWLKLAYWWMRNKQN